jgi:hypothetical protein
MRILTLLALAPLALFAQSTELTGRVTDPSGQLVPGASIRLTQQSTLLALETKSNDSGYYFFPRVQPGLYRISVASQGFKTVERTGITIASADRRRVDFQLELGSVTDTVNVTADASQLQLDSAEVSTTVSSREYAKLPQIQYNRMRSPANFIYLSPGVHGNVGANGRETVAASNNIRINGSRSTSNELYMDGIPGRTNFNETAPPVDAINEFKLQANQLSAEYGNTGSAVVTFSIKSGTNNFHGLLFNIFRNEKLDARSFLSPTRSTLRQNEFGGTFGGPVLIPKIYNGKNRTFFFFSYTGSRKRGLDQTQRLRVPTAAERQGDYSANPRVVYDPATTLSTGATFTRQPFPGNRIPTARFDSVASKITALLPAANLTGAGLFNYQDFIGERLLDPDVYLGRFDHSFSTAHRVFGTYNFTFIPRQNQTAAMADPWNDRTLQNITSHMVRVNHDWIVSPNLLNSATYGFNRFRNPFQGFHGNQGYAAKFGLKNIVGDAFPTFTFGDSYSPLGRNSLSDSTESSIVAKNILSWTRSKQLLKFGVEFRQFRGWSVDQSTSAGNYTFSNQGTALPTSLNNTGDSFASFLLGQTGTASLSLPFESANRKPYWGFFLQDDYRITSRLTLNLGLRYEFMGAPVETKDQYSLVDLSVANPTAGNRPGASIFATSSRRRLYSADYSAIGPRFGFAYSFGRKMVARGGYGLFYGDNDLNPVTTGFRTVAGFQTLDQGVTPPFLLQNGFPGTFSATPALGPAILNGQNVTALSSSATRNPRTQNWSMSLQRELTANWTAELSYVANKATRLASAAMINDNQVDPRYLSLGSVLTQQVTSSAAVAAGVTRPWPTFTGTVAQALRPYPQYLTVTEQSAKAGASFFQSFVARIRKRYSSGVTLDTHYTYSKLLGTSDTTQDHFKRGAEWTYLNYDIPHSLVLQYTYEIPGTTRLRALTGGWNINGIHRYQSGTPLFVTVNNTLPLFNRTLRPDAVSGASRTNEIGLGDFQANSNRRINAAAFRSPAPFTFGNAAASYGDLRNFRVFTEDFSIVKNTRLAERANLEFTAAFINAFNRHRFTDFVANLNNPTFGQATGSSLGRIITLGLKLKF